MTCAKKSNTLFDVTALDHAENMLMRFFRKPRVDAVTMMPTNMNDTGCTHMPASGTEKKPNTISNDRVTGSLRGSLSKMMLTVAITILYTQYTLRKYPNTLKKRPLSVLDLRIFSCDTCMSDNSKNSSWFNS